MKPTFLTLLFIISLSACTSSNTHKNARSAANNAGLFGSMRDLRQGSYQRHIDNQKHLLQRKQQITNKNQQRNQMLQQQSLQKKGEVTQRQKQLKTINLHNNQSQRDIYAIQNSLHQIESQRRQVEQELITLKLQHERDLTNQRERQQQQKRQQQLERKNINLLLKKRNLLRQQLELLINTN